ncbi:FAD-dependent oxidoreductase [Nonomuraea soli]|uniref:FAD-dependent oxidoreductase n=1 Tax=Nonomuraea soli TaxID=1032476 RepID=A0A7W0CDY7_9ACTN|nr:FAD-dependent oxidoreductase [Nonomuraea soli]MBA2889393.1 hypothetical protein [Nonomuraea soli]
MNQHQADVVIVGGGLGGVAAARAALLLGRSVILTEATDWLGGQLTSQGVPPDEHPWIEQHGSRGYRALREGIRDHYRRAYPLTPSALGDPLLNPGHGFVSALCHEPRVAAAVLDEMLSSWVAQGRLLVLREHEPVAAARDGDRLTSVTVRHRDGSTVRLGAGFILDATELGDLLELAHIPYVMGAESRAQTGELHAPDRADPLDQQAITWCAAVEYRAGESHVIDEPAGYRHWRDTVDKRWPGPQLSWLDVHPITLEERDRPLFLRDPDEAACHDDRGLWHYRRILSRALLDRPGFADISLINWPQTDYWELPLLGVDAQTRQTALRRARDLTLSFVRWMQTEAPRHDGGKGYPELRLRGDVLGTLDGLAKTAYIRESRRMKALFTVTEAHVGHAMRGPGAGSAIFDDSVGIGYYRIDLHPSTSGRTYVDIASYPFQIPLGALVSPDVANFVPANKNIGTTHISNGAYRLHPVEWSIGEAAGALAVHCLDTGRTPAEVRAEPRDFQELLSGALGVPLAWPDDIRRATVD